MIKIQLAVATVLVAFGVSAVVLVADARSATAQAQPRPVRWQQYCSYNDWNPLAVNDEGIYYCVKKPIP